MADDPRVPRNLQGALQMAAAFTPEGGSTDEQGQPVTGPLSDERQEFLNAALSSMSVDFVQQMRGDLSVLQSDDSSNEELEDLKIDALEDLMDICENMDNARDFSKIGGFDILPKLFTHSDPEIRWRTAELVADITQNHEEMQKVALERKLMPLLLELIEKDGADIVRVKSLFALSCICRNYTPAQNELIQKDGITCLLKAMQSGVEKLQIKSVFLLKALVSGPNKKQFIDILHDMGMLEQLVGLLHGEHQPFHEHILSALLLLVSNDQRLLSECRRQELGLSDLLEERKKLVKGQDEFHEEYVYAEQLQRLCFTETDQCGDR